MKNNKYNGKLFKMRHSAEHVLMQAMRNLGYKFHTAMGPATDEGFYFDFELLEGSLSKKDFPKIEREIKKIIKADLPIIHQKLSVKAARNLFKGNPYKQEWLDEIEKDRGEASVYWTGRVDGKDSFVDLCQGPHLNSTGEIGAVKLLSIAGAYWRGNEKNKMLTRIYATAFPSQKELNKYLNALEEAKKRDHRKLGKELDLFTFSNLVGSGLPLYTEKGTVIINQLYKALLEISEQYGVREVKIPHMAKIDLYKISGHAEKFKDELFKVVTHYNTEFVLKPVNCPHHTQLYASKPRSYKDLPIRYIESTAQHRDEKPGEIGGLTRTRSFIVDDGHTFCTVEQIKTEAKNTCKIIRQFYESLGLWGNHWVSLSMRDPKTPEKYIGKEEDWNKAEKMIKEISNELDLKGKIVEGEAAIYGPKIDYMFKDALGNERQLATVQIDFAMPKRFGLSYIDKDSQEKTPVMLHRAILGSYERFLAILLEHFGGAFPVWLSPVQVQVISISNKNVGYAQKVAERLNQENIRVELDDKDETMANKIRKAQEQKIPYMLILGAKEQSSQTVSVRYRNGKQDNQTSLEAFTKRIKRNIISKSLEV